MGSVCGIELMGIGELVKEHRAEILRIAAANGATRVCIFGSVARGTVGPESDLDLLIDLAPGSDLFDLIAIKQDIEDLLDRPVHVVTEPAVSPYMRDAVLRDATPL